MGEKPGKYWDCHEARWVRFDAAAAEPGSADIPAPAEPIDARPVVSSAEADVRSG